ncbi:MAG TPA: prolipoprotein diacylglyceryl transferase, partial [Polyangiaceae bacterium]|nr:prolipoprotein diacylglyceryl transferase [Polyangiaceae bacterium]
AVIGLIIAMYLFCKRRGVPFLEGSDRFVFSATLGATVVRIGNLMNSEIVGRVVPDQSWGMRFPRHDHNVAEVPLRYPSQIFEILLGTGVFIGLLLADRFMGYEKRPRGALISWFFVLYFGGRLFTERYKEIEALPPDSAITMGQYLSFPGVLLGLYGLWRAYKRREPAGWVEPGDEREREEADVEDDDAEKKSSVTTKPASQTKSETESKDEDDEADDAEEDGDEDGDAEKPSGDPDVDAEFEDGKLKKRRDA